MSHFRLFWTATIALLPFLSRFLRSSLPSINFGSHILHLRDSGWAVKQKYIKCTLTTHWLLGHLCTMWDSGRRPGIFLYRPSLRIVKFWKSHPRVVEATIEGQSTFGMERTKGGKVEKLQIVEGASTLRWKLINFIRLNNVYNCKIVLLFSPLNSQESFGSQGVKIKGFPSEISLLHINCEGCEWEMLENLIGQPDVMSKV